MKNCMTVSESQTHGLPLKSTPHFPMGHLTWWLWEMPSQCLSWKAELMALAWDSFKTLINSFK